MFSLIGFGLAVAALVAAGAFIVWAVRLTIKAFREKARKKLEVEKAKKLVMANLKEMASDPEANTVGLDELDRLADSEGYTHVMGTVDEDGEFIGDVELVKDENSSTDEGIKKLLGNRGFVVIEK